MKILHYISHFLFVPLLLIALILATIAEACETIAGMIHDATLP